MQVFLFLIYLFDSVMSTSGVRSEDILEHNTLACDSWIIHCQINLQFFLMLIFMLKELM